MENFLDALIAKEATTERAEHLMLFGQFVGSWDVKVKNYPLDGTTVELDAEWHFSWTLGGRAVMDVWIGHKNDGVTRTTYEHGVTIRFYDPSIDAWRSTWIGPVRKLVLPFSAKQIRDEIVLEASFEEGIVTQWIFHHIEKDRFSWKNIESSDNKKSWRVNQVMEATRRI